MPETRSRDLTATVAICTWNRSQLLAKTLEGLRSLVVPSGVSWELLIVDNNSSDDTKDTINRFCGLLPIRAVLERQQGLAHARNRALHEARGSFVLFTDDDVLVDPSWLAAALETWSRFPEAVLMGGPIEPWFPEDLDPEMARVFPLLASGYCGLDYHFSERLLGEEHEIYGACFGVRLDAVNGLEFNRDLGPRAGRAINGDEIDFLRRVRAQNGAVAWSPGMRVRHYVEPKRMTLGYVLQFYFDNARHLVRMNGLAGGRALGGVPLWLWRQTVETFLALCAARAVGTRRRRLVALRDHAVTRGMLVEAWSGRTARRWRGTGRQPVHS